MLCIIHNKNRFLQNNVLILYHVLCLSTMCVLGFKFVFNYILSLVYLVNHSFILYKNIKYIFNVRW